MKIYYILMFILNKNKISYIRLQHNKIYQSDI